MCRFFSSLCYSADGVNLLAGGRSKFVCIYNVRHQILLKKFQVSRNMAFDGMMVSVSYIRRMSRSLDYITLLNRLHAAVDGREKMYTLHFND